jgi:hypothetical protein
MRTWLLYNSYCYVTTVIWLVSRMQKNADVECAQYGMYLLVYPEEAVAGSCVSCGVLRTACCGVLALAAGFSS